MASTHVVLATDGSEPSLAAAGLVRDLVNSTALAGISVLAVVAPIEQIPFYGAFATFGGGTVSQAVWDEMSAEAERSAQEAIRRTVAELHATVPVESVVRHGQPPAEIVRYAEEIGAGLIVMGSRGWGELHAALVGSVSERVLHTAHCPVMIARSTPAHAA